MDGRFVVAQPFSGLHKRAGQAMHNVATMTAVTTGILILLGGSNRLIVMSSITLSPRVPIGGGGAGQAAADCARVRADGNGKADPPAN